MWFWNRVEIYSGFSLKEFSELREALAADGIKYDCRFIGRDKNDVYRQKYVQNEKIPGHVRPDPKFTIQYYLYVHHKDYDKAMYLTSNRNA